MFLWDIILVNEKDTTSFNENDLTQFNSVFFISSHGNVELNREILSNVRCPMNLKRFPHDTQDCKMRFQSYVYSRSKLNFSSAEVIIYETALKADSYHILGWNGLAHDDTITYTHGYSEVTVTIKLKRKLEFYIYQVS